MDNERARQCTELRQGYIPGIESVSTLISALHGNCDTGKFKACQSPLYLAQGARKHRGELTTVRLFKECQS